MKKDKANQLFREHVKNNLSPTMAEQSLVSSVYDAIRTALGRADAIATAYAATVLTEE
jgi:hypothetical protein